MKITLIVTEDDYGAQSHKVLFDGKFRTAIHSLGECPEDAIIGRDLVDGHDIVDFIQMGYDVAKRGETLEVEIKEGKEE